VTARNICRALGLLALALGAVAVLTGQPWGILSVGGGIVVLIAAKEIR
jgi:hypothetical protein